MSQLQEVYIVSAVRTPVGKAPRGIFRTVRPDDLLTHVIKESLNQVPELDKNLVEDVIVGCAMPEAEQGMNVARIGALLADLPDHVAGMTINRFCSSGLQSIAIANDRIRLGAADVMIAGGTESMSMVPMGGYHLSANPNYFTENEKHVAIAFGMGITAEIVAQKYNVTREQQDEFAFNSHQKALKAQAAGDLKAEISPYTMTLNLPEPEKMQIQQRQLQVLQDEGPRKDTSIEALAKLRPVFSVKGSVTAGNSSQMSDGAAACVLVSEKILKQFNLKPLAQLKSFSVAGVPPEVMGIGPVKAIPKALQLANVKLDEIEWIELNEAFAAQSLAVIKEAQLNPEIVNPVGSAIALGHPLGATGAIRTATIIHGMRQRKQKYGMVTMCIGTGMGAAGVFEVFN
ncbi:MAG: acetyl-CoA C-acyltransferase [Pseudomonadota bacterium]